MVGGWLEENCRRAAEDLGVTVQVPFVLISADGAAHGFAALFEQFGSGKGVLICGFDEWIGKNPIAAAHGYYCSGLHPDSYSRYDRRLWIEAFLEWGWRGPEKDKPRWYGG